MIFICYLKMIIPLSDINIRMFFPNFLFYVYYLPKTVIRTVNLNLATAYTTLETSDVFVLFPFTVLLFLLVFLSLYFCLSISLFLLLSNFFQSFTILFLFPYFNIFSSCFFSIFFLCFTFSFCLLHLSLFAQQLTGIESGAKWRGKKPNNAK